MKRLVCLCAVTLFAAAPAFGWGCKGHQVIALIALDQLQPAVRGRVDQILAADPVDADPSFRGCSAVGLPPIAAVANWADEERWREPATEPYHFVNIPLGAKRKNFDYARLCNETCVSWAIAHYEQQLTSAGTAVEQRAAALRYVIHFVGDIHQPLHTEDNADEGGNCVRVHYLGSATLSNLHAVWDTSIITTVSGALSARAWATQIERAEGRVRPGSSTLEDWAWQSHDLALRYAYRPLPIPIGFDASPPVASCSDRHSRLPVERIDQAYVDQAAPVIEMQLDLAGVRLAQVLNKDLGK